MAGLRFVKRGTVSLNLISVEKKRRDYFVAKDPKSSELTAGTPHFTSKVVSSAGGCGQTHNHADVDASCEFRCFFFLLAKMPHTSF